MKKSALWGSIAKNSFFRFFGLFSFPIILGLLALFFWIGSVFLSWQIQAQQLASNPLPTFTPAAYPVVERQFQPQISATAAYVVDTDSLAPVFAKNAHIRLSPASTTKIMTALVALSYYHLSDVITIERPYVEGSGLHLVQGEKFTFENLLYAMMLPSANDAAYAIADNYPGGMPAFVAKMNEKARELHLDDTHYQDSAGLTDDGDYTTAHDEAILASVALKNSKFAKVVDTKSYAVSSIDGLYKYPVNNLNELLGLYGVFGVKTGYTDEAGQVLVTATHQNGHTFIIVVMRSEDRFADTEKLLQMLFHNISFISIKP